LKILALETSAKSVSVAVAEEGVLLCSAYQNTGLTHSRTLLPLIDDLLKTGGLSVEDIDVIAVAAGPGSFTGLRIGISTAKGLAWAAEKRCCAVSTLEAMAENARLFTGLVLCAMDARRNQIYNAVFRAEGGVLTRVTSDRAISLAELAEELKEEPAPKMVVGDGAVLCYTYLSEQGIPCSMAPMCSRMQQAAGVAAVAERMAQPGQLVSPQELLPTYLRLSQAERERLARGEKITVD
jgi:tRNA threonylcarbamoyladenosine biosynthesis protein TsaB